MVSLATEASAYPPPADEGTQTVTLTVKGVEAHKGGGWHPVPCCSDERSRCTAADTPLFLKEQRAEGHL